MCSIRNISFRYIIDITFLVFTKTLFAIPCLGLEHMQFYTAHLRSAVLLLFRENKRQFANRKAAKQKRSLC